MSPMLGPWRHRRPRFASSSRRHGAGARSLESKERTRQRHVTSLLRGRSRYRVLCAAIACCLAVTLLTLLVRDARPRLVDANGVSVLVDGANGPPESFDLDGTGGELVLLGESCLGVGGNPGRMVAWPRGSEVATG